MGRGSVFSRLKIVIIIVCRILIDIFMIIVAVWFWLVQMIEIVVSYKVKRKSGKLSFGRLYGTNHLKEEKLSTLKISIWNLDIHI